MTPGKRDDEHASTPWQRGRAGVAAGLSQPKFIAALVWIGAYGLVALTGQRFDTAYLDYGWQMLPRDVLSSSPISGVTYLHIQPPLWNLIVGLCLRWSPFPDGITLQLLQAFIGAFLAGTLATVLCYLRVSRRVSTVVAVLCCINPEVLASAFTPTYELMVALLIARLMAVVLAPVRSARRSVVAVAATLSLLPMTRALYHPVLWIAVVVGVLGAIRWRSVTWRTCLSIALLGLLAPGVWAMKNYVLFRVPAVSSWSGMNLQRSIFPLLSNEQITALQQRGDVSPVSSVPAFSRYDAYRPLVTPCMPDHSHRAVAIAERGGALVAERYANLNYECYIAVYRTAGGDAAEAIRAYPGRWVYGRAWSLAAMFTRSSALPVTSRSPALRFLGSVYAIARLDVPYALDTRAWNSDLFLTIVAESRLGVAQIALYGAVLIAGLMLAVKARRSSSASSPETVVLAIAGATILYTVVVGITGDLGEQARFRSSIDPIVWCAGFVLAQLLWRRQRRLSATNNSTNSTE